jgi:alkanesulfonate monooxygenase SsuD/methylene tetrahydromethanopterin reductase-like flavin-dependent oxidoreductase (luciferase family)
MADSMLACSVIGSPDTVRHGLERFAAYSGADELMVVSAIFDPLARKKSYSLLADIAGLQAR